MRAAASESRAGRDRPVPGRPAKPTGVDPATLEAVFREHADTVLRAAYRVTGRMSDAEDVLQTVFLRLMRRDDGLELGAGAGSYLRRAAINAGLDVVRSRRRRRSVDLDGDSAPQLSDDAPDAERRRAGHEARDEVRRALARVGRTSPKAAEIFALRYFEDLPNKEIARQLSMSQTAVAVNLHRTRSRLREELGAPRGGLS